MSPSYKLWYNLEKSKYFPIFTLNKVKLNGVNFKFIQKRRTVSFILKNDLKSEIESRVWKDGENVFDTGRKRVVKIDHGNKPSYD